MNDSTELVHIFPQNNSYINCAKNRVEKAQKRKDEFTQTPPIQQISGHIKPKSMNENSIITWPSFLLKYSENNSCLNTIFQCSIKAFSVSDSGAARKLKETYLWQVFIEKNIWGKWRKETTATQQRAISFFFFGKKTLTLFLTHHYNSKLRKCKFLLFFWGRWGWGGVAWFGENNQVNNGSKIYFSTNPQILYIDIFYPLCQKFKVALNKLS